MFDFFRREDRTEHQAHSHNDVSTPKIEEEVSLDSNGLCDGCSSLIASAVLPPSEITEPHIRYRLEWKSCKLCPLLYEVLRTVPHCRWASPFGYVEFDVFSLL